MLRAVWPRGIDGRHPRRSRANAHPRAGTSTVPTIDNWRSCARASRREDRSSLRPLFNLTGTVFTPTLAAHYSPKRRSRQPSKPCAIPSRWNSIVDGQARRARRSYRGLLCDLTGAEDATVVNNNAAAVLLSLNTLAGGREAIVSRGELIEIGGAFRMPDIMARAGARWSRSGRRTARMRRITSGNSATGVILKVHTSNYRILGFTAEVGARELAEIAAEANVPLMNDLGSGTLVDLSRYGLQNEPTVREAVAQGAGIVTFSGDKLLGGPQAGFIVGKRALIEVINRNPMKRALRVDKIRLAAIEATLKLYRDPDRLVERLPTLRLLARSLTSQIRRSVFCPVPRRRPGIYRRAERMPKPDRIRRAAARHHSERWPCD